MTLILIAGLFFYEHHAFFEFAREQTAKGYHWKYTGPRECEAKEPCLPVIDEVTGKRLTYYMLTR